MSEGATMTTSTQCVLLCFIVLTRTLESLWGLHGLPYWKDYHITTSGPDG